MSVIRKSTGQEVASVIAKDRSWTIASKLMTEHLNASRSKHILLRCHTVKEQIMKFENFIVYWCTDKWQLADIFTKPLARPKFERMDRIIRGIDLVDYENLCKRIDPGDWWPPFITNDSVNLFIVAEGECGINLAEWLIELHDRDILAIIIEIMIGVELLQSFWVNDLIGLSCMHGHDIDHAWQRFKASSRKGSARGNIWEQSRQWYCIQIWVGETQFPPLNFS